MQRYRGQFTSSLGRILIFFVSIQHSGLGIRYSLLKYRMMNNELYSRHGIFQFLIPFLAILADKRVF